MQTDAEKMPKNGIQTEKTVLHKKHKQEKWPVVRRSFLWTQLGPEGFMQCLKQAAPGLKLSIGLDLKMVIVHEAKVKSRVPGQCGQDRDQRSGCKDLPSHPHVQFKTTLTCGVYFGIGRNLDPAQFTLQARRFAARS